MFEVSKRPISLDDLADVRYLHSSAFRMCGAAHHTEDEIDAYLSRINSNDYIRECLNCSLYGLWHGNMLIGTAGWCPSNDNRNTARLRKIYIHNFYVGLGLGRQLVKDTEERAANGGFEAFSIRAGTHAAPFFRHLGYQVTSYGALNTPKGPDLPVTYMRKTAMSTGKTLGHTFNLARAGRPWGDQHREDYGITTQTH